MLDEHGILCAYLERDGLRARTAADGREALRLMQQLRPDLVLLDIHPPEVVARVRAVLRRTQMRLDSASAPIRVGAIKIDAQAHSATCYARPATPSRCRSR